MISNLGFHTFLLAFLGYSVILSKLRSKTIGVKEFLDHIRRNPKKTIYPFYIAYIFIAIAIYLSGTTSVTGIFLSTSFFMFVIYHAIVVGKSFKNGYFVSTLILILLVMRTFHQSVWSHNLFLALTVLGISLFLVSFKILNLRRFTIFSLLWLAYDIFYIWLTPTYQYVAESSEKYQFPLALQFTNLSVGTADLLYASMLILLLRSYKAKIIAIFLFSLSNIILTEVLFDKLAIDVFPLLVLWVPIGVSSSYLFTKTKK